VRGALLGTLVTVLLLMTVQGGNVLRAGAAAAEPVGDARAEPDPDAVFTATMVGDVMFARHVERIAERHGHEAILREVAPWLRGDYVSANLEQVISDRNDLPEANKLILLRSDQRAAHALADAGFTIVSLANNHSMDHGLPGLRDTIAALDRAGLRHAGAGEDLDAAVATDLQEHGALVVATLSFTDVFVDGFIARPFQGGVLQAEPDVLAPLIQRADSVADLVIVHLHFGEEYDLGPNARQRSLVEVAAAAGADIIVGHHPHVLMPVERVGDTLVFYSLGNFVFDQGWSRTRESTIARYVLTADGTARVELVPVYIREGTPRVIAGPSGAYRRERIFQRLRGAGLDWRRSDGLLITEIDHAHVVAGHHR
jgi:gamma-polyglutamate biosynthesis protein CapA